MTDPFTVRIEPTPNPNSLKFTTNRTIAEGRARTYASPDDALFTPLAAKLLAVPGVRSVFFLREFVTVTRIDGAAWEPIAARVEQELRRHFAAEA